LTLIQVPNIPETISYAAYGSILYQLNIIAQPTLLQTNHVVK